MKKIIIMLITLLMSLSLVSALSVNNETQSLYQFENNNQDSLTSLTLVNVTAFDSSTVIRGSFSADVDNDRQFLPSTLNTSFSYTFWARVRDSAQQDFMSTESLGGFANGDMILRFDAGSDLRLITKEGGSSTVISFGAYNLNQWYHLGVTFNAGTNNIKFYVNGSLIGTTNDDVTDMNPYFLGRPRDGDKLPNALLDEFSIWNNTLSDADITNIFNNGVTLPSTAPIVNISAPTSGQFLDDLNFTLNTTTNILANLTFSLNGAANVSLCNNCNSSSSIILGSEGSNTIEVFGTNGGGVGTSQVTFTLDSLNPSLNVTLPSEFNSYTGFDFSNFISFSDPNIDTCVVSISGESNTICTDSSYTFVNNGNHTINVTVTDLAGNTNSSLNNLMLVNPVQLFNFQRQNGSAITNFVFAGLNFSTQANFSTFNDIISFGSNTLLFEKLGFASTNVSFNLNSTSDINLTTVVTESKIVVRIFDRQTNALLTGLTQITIQATQGFNGSTSSGLLNISNINFLNEQYQILAEHVGYTSETAFFNYDNQETLTVDIFMLNATATNAGTIQIIVKNSLSQLIESAICSALEWRPSESAFVSVAQGLTNVNGETLLNIELNTIIYEFSCTKDQFTTITNAQIVQVDLSSLTIILNDVILAPVPLFPNLATSLTNSSINATHQLVTYTFADSDGLTTEACLQSFLVNGNRQTFVQENCVSSSTGSILLTVNINQTADVLVRGVLTTPDVLDFVTDTLTFKGTGDISFSLAAIGMDILIPTIFILLGLGLGILLSNINIAITLMAVGAWMAVAFVPTVIGGSIAMFITVIVGLMLYGGFDKK